MKTFLEEQATEIKEKENQARAKSIYQKPRLRVIELVAEEVLAVGCKLPGSGIRGFGNPGPTCKVPRTCFGPGS